MARAGNGVIYHHQRQSQRRFRRRICRRRVKDDFRPERSAARMSAVEANFSMKPRRLPVCIAVYASPPARLISRPGMKTTRRVGEFTSCAPYSLGGWMWGPQRFGISTCASVAVPARPPAQAGCSTGRCWRRRAITSRNTTVVASSNGCCAGSSSSRFFRSRGGCKWLCGRCG